MSQFAAYKENRRAIVDVVNIDSVSGMKVALMTDLQTKGQFTIPMSAPGRIMPQEGDIWQLSRETGYWAFDKMIAKAQETVVSTMGQAVQVMADLGLMEFVPEYRGHGDLTSAPIEMPVGAHVGQIRWLYSDDAPAGWLKLDGSLYSRLRYRRLYNQWGTTYGVGDGATTFGSPKMTPFVFDATAATWRQWAQPWGLLDQSGFFSVVTSGTTDTVGAARLINTTMANRLIRMDYNHDSGFGSVLADIFQVNNTMDSTALGSATTNLYIASAGNYYGPSQTRVIFTTTGTSHTFRTIAKRITGTGTLTFRGYTYLYDDGQAASPPVASIWPYVYSGGV